MCFPVPFFVYSAEATALVHFFQVEKFVKKKAKFYIFSKNGRVPSRFTVTGHSNIWHDATLIQHEVPGWFYRSYLGTSWLSQCHDIKRHVWHEIFFTGQLDPGGDSGARSINMKKFNQKKFPISDETGQGEPEQFWAIHFIDPGTEIPPGIQLTSEKYLVSHMTLT